MDRGTWWAAVHGVATSQTRLSGFPFTFHFHALEKEMATHSSVLGWRIPGTGEPGGLPSMGSHRVGHDRSDAAVAAARPPPCFLSPSLSWFLCLNRVSRLGFILHCLGFILHLSVCPSAGHFLCVSPLPLTLPHLFPSDLLRSEGDPLAPPPPPTPPRTHVGLIWGPG